ncbi:glycosyltransferase [Sandarakinorhabdus sp.]|uniref:glycosyltransferase n=1 Tax=Sandarakinorhabdus sp. TaxID=1916663 RepID=UPI00286DBF2A|nr:glycosyltransferase [Sandarakinorhabdus sp.]
MIPALDTAPLLLVAAPLLLVLAALLAAPLFGLERPGTRAGIVLGVALMVGAYLHWRLTVTIPWDGGWLGLAFAFICLGVELFGLFDAAILFAALLRRTNRSPEADIHERRLHGMLPARLPTVDLLIATYNEPIEVLEKTIIGALALDWPNLNVWVADDGRREWLRDYCRSKGAGYITRPDNFHAKAGNINHALGVTSAPFVAVFDADFVPQRGFLMRTMGFFDDPGIGIVQVPHSFYNHDPMQQNLALRDAMPDDQRFFFEAIMPGRDGWDSAFCCGSNSITRREAFEAIGGGLPSGSITEDMLLTLALLKQGFVTRYLNEPLAFGLAPESLAAFFVQRARWAQGAVQILFLKEGPLGPGVALRHRLFFLPTAWLSQCLMLLVSVIAPLVFLFFDLPPLVGVTAQSAIFHLLPMVAAQVGGIVLLGGGRYFPIAAQVLGLFQSFKLLPVIIKTLWQPYGHAFKVTPKGADAAGGGTERGIFLACAGLMLATLLGLVINAFPDTRIVAQGALVPMVAFWGGINCLVLMLAAMMCFGRPALRAEERFAYADTVAVWHRGNRAATIARGIDLSLSGIALAGEGLAAGDPVRVRLPGIGSLDGRVARAGHGRIGIAFSAEDCGPRDRLIERLFTNSGNTLVGQVPLWSATRALLASIWRAETGLVQMPSVRPRIAEPRLEKRSFVLPPAARFPARAARMG